jgi:16S rRNA (cytosine1402-N4)-methyltransferase
MNAGSLIPTPRHVPVLLAQVLDFLAPAPDQTIVDATIGAGGHALGILERMQPTGRLIGFDQDPVMLDMAKTRLEAARRQVTVDLIHANFDALPIVLREQGIDGVDAVLADLGVCSDQLDDPARGLSFQVTGPLDMRLDPSRGEPASALLRRLGERDLADIFWMYGEERYSRRIARRIVESRHRDPLETTDQLAGLIRRSVPWPKGRRPRIDPATRAFQALRIAVNDELGALERFLKSLPGCIRAGGRAVIISFHSLEDRQVKRTFRDRRYWEELTRKPVRANATELRKNPRAASAKLRAARRKTDPC